MRYKKIILGLLCFTIFSCSTEQTSKYKSSPKVITDEFSTKVKLSGAVLNVPTDDIGNVLSMIVIDNYLIISDLDKDFLFKQIDINSGQILRKFGRKGEGKAEYLFPSFLQVLDNEKKIGLFNKPKLDYFVMDFDDLLEGKEALNKTGKLSIDFQRILKIGENFVGIGSFENRYALTDNKANILGSFLEYPFKKELEKVSFRVLAMAYQGKLLAHPKQPMFVLATTNGVCIDICKVANQTVIPIRQIHLSHPLFESTDGQIISATMLEGSQVGFLSACVSDKYIYLLYSGKAIKKKDDSADTSNTVLVYDWQGQAKNIFELDGNATQIAVDKFDNQLFAFFNEEKPYFKVYELANK
jgi:hypothetical protein